MKNNNNPQAQVTSKNESLRHLANDLREVYGVLNELCSQLEGGGIVKCKDVEPAVAQAIPKLRRAVAALNAASMLAEGQAAPDPSAATMSAGQNPLLM
jgi:hypothetical protein